MTNSKMTKEQIREKRFADMAERRDVVEDCCTVSGPHPLLGSFEEDIFKHDNWNVEDALNYLAGVKKMSFKNNMQGSLEIWTLSKENYSDDVDGDITKGFQNEIGRLWEIWTSGDHQNPNPPSYYIEWALSKNIKIHWLEYAIEKGLYKSSENKSSASTIEPSYETELLKLLNLAVSQFFNPRKPLDAKQEEVTQWLKNKGQELDVYVSDNVAEAIFTIIKPKDHNPKIKRVQPLD